MPATIAIKPEKAITRLKGPYLPLTVLAVLVLASMLLSVTVGAMPIDNGQAVSILLRAIGIKAGIAYTEQQEVVLMAIRLPRVLFSMLLGAGLAVAGASMQGLFRNPLVSPALVGVSSGAMLAAVVCIVFGTYLFGAWQAELSLYTLPLAAFIGGGLATLAAYYLSLSSGRSQTVILILAGVAITALAEAVVGFVLFYASDVQIRDFTFWRLGSLGGADWEKLAIAAPLIGLPSLWMLGQWRALNALSLGEAEAFHLGVRIERVKYSVVFLTALVVGTGVAFAGLIGFVGLVVPHLVRMMLGADHRFVLPGSLLAGALLLTVSDMAARTVVQPAELPIGVVTAGFGVPFFIWLLLKNKSQYRF